MVDKINNKLDFSMELGNIVRDHLPKVPKNPRRASWDTSKKAKGPSMVKINLIYCDVSLIVPLKQNIFLHICVSFDSLGILQVFWLQMTYWRGHECMICLCDINLRRRMAFLRYWMPLIQINFYTIFVASNICRISRIRIQLTAFKRYKFSQSSTYINDINFYNPAHISIYRNLRRLP